MVNSFSFGSTRKSGAGAIASASLFVLSACAYGVDTGLNISAFDGGTRSGTASGITGPTGSGGRAAASSSGSSSGVGSSGEGGFGGMSGVGAGTGGAITGGSATAGSATAGSATAGSATGVGGTAGAGGSAESGAGGTAGQAGTGGGGGASVGGRDGGSAGGAGGSTAGAGGGGGSAGAGGGGAGGTGGAGGKAGASGAGGAGGMVVRDAGPLVSFDDGVVGTGTNQFNYAGTWDRCAPCTTATTPPLFNTSNSWADGTVTSQIVTFAFVGSQVLFYGIQDPRYGIGAVSIDNGAETPVDFYAAARAGNHLLWTSPFFTPGAHTFRLHSTATKNAASTGLTITVDRLEVH